jgi:hypothetical protein
MNENQDNKKKDESNIEKTQKLISINQIQKVVPKSCIKLKPFEESKPQTSVSKKQFKPIPIDKEILQFVTRHSEKTVELFIPYDDKKGKVDLFIPYNVKSDKGIYKEIREKFLDDLKKKAEIKEFSVQFCLRDTNKYLSIPVSKKHLLAKEYTPIELQKVEYQSKTLDDIIIKTRREFSKVDVQCKYNLYLLLFICLFLGLVA